MRKIIISVALATACLAAAPAFAKDNPNELGKGDYYVVVAPDLRTGEPQQMTTADFDLMKRYDLNCRSQMKGQRPSGGKVIVGTMLRNAPGAAVGAVIGSKISGIANQFVTSKDYGLYTGVGSAGASIGAGITMHAMDKSTSVAGCMMNIMNRAHQAHILMNISVAFNTSGFRGHPIKRSSLPPPGPDDDVVTASVNRAPAPAAAAPAPPPPASNGSANTTNEPSGESGDMDMGPPR